MQTAPTASMGHLGQSVQAAGKMQPSSSRILLDVPCKVCRDNSSGKHYGIYACDGCAGFFKRSIRRSRQYACKAKAEGGCMVDKTHRNQCRACRLAKCIQAGMNRDAVQHERGPRNSTLRRQMAIYYGGKDTDMITTMVPPPNAALDLVLPKPPLEPRASVATPAAHRPLPHPIYTNIGLNKMSPAAPSCPPALGAFAMRPPLPLFETMCESAARLLFVNVQWARELNANSGLCVEDQLTILEASWRELFLLAAAQYVPSLDPSPLVGPGPQSVGLALEAARFRDTLVSFGSLGLSQEEYSCVREVVLYKAGLECSGESGPCSSRSSSGSASPGQGRLRDAHAVVRLRDSAQTALGEKMAATSSFGALRFSKLILMLPMLRSVSPTAIEEFFFRKTIGETPIENIICDVYRQK